MQKDDFLVQQTLAGEHEAFHRLIILYQADVYALVMSWVKNPEDAKELVQDIFLEAYRDLASLKQPERFYFWLRQIAKHRCQNWQERKRQFVPLSEDMVAETPSVDETLILRETLAKMMQAIDELPETEKRILKERYLDDSSYAELQAKHGLSYKALNMRLSRAKEKVRQRVEKLLSGIGIFSWHDALNKMLLGGVEAMKISAKVKIIAIGVGAVLVLGGAGVIVWNHQSTQERSLTTISQTNQQGFLKGSAKTPVKGTLVVSMSKTNQTSDYTKLLKQEQQKPEVSEGKTEYMQPKIASGTETSKTDASKTAISPELEVVFNGIKSYLDKIKAIGELQKPYADRISEVSTKLDVIQNAFDKETSNEKRSRLNEEYEQLAKESRELAVPYNQLYAQIEQTTKEMDEYVQAHYGMSYQQFSDTDTYSETFRPWLMTKWLEVKDAK